MNRYLHIVPVMESHNIIQFILCIDADTCIIRITFVWFVHSCCSCTKCAVLQHFHRANGKTVTLITCAETFVYKSFCIFNTFKETLFVISYVHFSFFINCTVCIKYTSPVFTRERCKVIRLNPCDTAFI